MLAAGFPKEEIERAYRIAKAQAAVDGAFPDELMQSWFEAAWELCAEMVGYLPPQEITETISIDDRGRFRLSHQPSGPVRIYAGYTLVTTLPPTLTMSPCDPGLCCFCNLTARYMIGSASCVISARFTQAVARLFTYLCENRGDTELDEHVLMKSGALAFLAPDLAYVA